MSRISFLPILFMLLNVLAGIAQTDSTQTTKEGFPLRTLSVEPAIGIHSMPLSDIVVSNLVQWNTHKHFHVVARTSFSFNTAFSRNFNYIHTDYSYSLSQTVGVGTSVYSKRASHSFSLMAGVKYDTNKETLNNPEFEQVSFALNTVSPDLGFMYHYTLGQKKYFFSFRMYVPVYPYPFKNFDINTIDGNMANLSLEFGLGIRLK